MGYPIVIDAGRVVTKDLSDNAVAVRNPCKIIRMMK